MWVKTPLVLLFAVFFIFVQTGCAEELPKIIISRVQISGGDGKSYNDFVQLLNAGNKPIDLKGYRLIKRTKSAAVDTTLKSWTSSVVLPAKSFYLWANSKDGFGQSIFSDVSMSGYISADNGIALRKGNENTGEIVDLMGWGECNKDFFIGHIFNGNPEASEIITRDTKELSSFKYVLECSILPKHLGDIWNAADEFNICQKLEAASQSVVIGKLAVDEDIYENVYANFEIAKKTDEKVIWNFGDGHKSYLAKTKHKYEKTGEYDASVKVYKDENENIQNFTVIVESFPHPKIRIIAINANPKGADTGVETLTIANKSKKKINLFGWSIATGAKKKLSNHPITEKFVLKKKQTKEITREFSKFSLNNKKGKIELRYPDGKVADKIKYDHGKISIADDEIYAKVDKKWNWIPSVQSQKTIKSIKQDAVINSSLVTESLVTENAALIVPIKVEREIEPLLLATDDVVQIELLKSQPQVLGTETVREIDGQYFFTPQNVEQEHYAIKFLKNISADFNLKLNMLLNYFK